MEINIEHLDEWAGVESEVDFALAREDTDQAFLLLNVYVCRQDALLNTDQRVSLVASKIMAIKTEMAEKARNKKKPRVVSLIGKILQGGRKAL